MLAVHRARRTWHRDVDAFIALTDFGRDRFIAGGLPVGRLVVKPNFASDEGDPHADESSTRSQFANGPVLFVGRLAPEKGIRTLLAAWPRVDGQRRRLRIVGGGPLVDDVRTAAAATPGITFVGPVSRDEVQAEMRSAAAHGLSLGVVRGHAAEPDRGLRRRTTRPRVPAGGHGEHDRRTGEPGSCSNRAIRAPWRPASPSRWPIRPASRRWVGRPGAPISTRTLPEPNYARLAAIYRSAVARRAASTRRVAADGTG